MMKRAGRGNIKSGIVTMSHGDLAVACPACPCPDINLPANWKDTDPSLK